MLTLSNKNAIGFSFSYGQKTRLVFAGKEWGSALVSWLSDTLFSHCPDRMIFGNLCGLILPNKN